MSYYKWNYYYLEQGCEHSSKQFIGLLSSNREDREY